MSKERNDERSGYIPRGYISVEVEGNKIDIPKYEFGGAYCALFTRLAADLAFDLKYEPCNAWDHVERNRVVERAKEFNELETLSDNGVLKKGMIIGFFNPHSSQNQPEREFTHVGLYLGDGKVAHFYKETLVENYAELINKKLSPRVIIEPKT
jgi:cell wall-associated NlpC family hydrolase